MLYDFTYKEDSVLLSISTNTNANTNANAAYLALNTKYFLSKGSRTRSNQDDKPHQHIYKYKN